MSPILPIRKAITLSGDARFDAFCKYAGYMADAPEASRYQYVIRVGSQALYSNDTYELREKFYAHITKLKRNVKRKAHNEHNQNSRRNRSKMQRR